MFQYHTIDRSKFADRTARLLIPQKKTVYVFDATDIDATYKHMKSTIEGSNNADTINRMADAKEWFRTAREGQRFDAMPLFLITVKERE